MKTVRNRAGYYTYRCKICGWENFKKRSPESTVPVTKLGNYGDSATPPPTTYTDEMMVSTTISFTAASGDDPAQLSDSLCRFADFLFKGGMTLVIVTDSGTNDGTYTIADKGVSRCEIRLSASDSLTTENAATAGEVTISRTIYKPNVTTGCGFCGSLNSR